MIVDDISGILRTPLSEILSIRIAGQKDFDIFIRLQLCAGVAQLAEQLFCKQQVVGSSPSAGFWNGFICRGPLKCRVEIDTVEVMKAIYWTPVWIFPCFLLGD